MEDDSLVADDEGHDACLVVLRRPGDEGEAADHVSVDDIIIFAAGRVFSLAEENFIMLAVKGPARNTGLRGVAAGFGLGDEGT